MAFATNHDLIKRLIVTGFADAAGGPKFALPQAKTADYTIVTGTDPSGTVFTNRGAAGSVTFTLPAPIRNLAGTAYDFIGAAAQTFAVSAGAGNGVAFNNAACASVTCSTGGQKIGAHIRAICDGTSWLLNGDTVGVTYTVA